MALTDHDCADGAATALWGCVLLLLAYRLDGLGCPALAGLACCGAVGLAGGWLLAAAAASRLGVP